MNTSSPLRRLADLISEAVDSIEAQFLEKGLSYPKLSVPFNPASPEEGLSMSPEVVPSAMLIVSACAQLSAIVNIPALSLYDAVGGFHVASALRVALEANIVEILRGQKDGVHVTEISKRNGMEPVRIGRVLRLLATHHIFSEVSPDVFANNRLSSMMDTMKTLEEIDARPSDKHVNTPGVAALLEHSADEVMKSSAFLTEVLLDKNMGHSDAVGDTAFAYAFRTKKHVFEWYEEPGNEHRHKRFMAAMEGASKLDPPNAILSGFDWGSLAQGAVVVDVGGGLGHAALTIHEKYPALKLIVQDRPKVVKEARAFWSSHAPNATSTGSVTLQEHDFYKPQIAQNPAVYMCGMILHDHGKTRAKQILTHLRNGAGRDTKLLVIDQVVQYACLGETTHDVTRGIKGARPMPAPPPLLSNLGKANAIAYIGDFQMFSTNGGEERTVGSFSDLFKESGWKIVEIFAIPGSIHKQILADVI